MPTAIKRMMKAFFIILLFSSTSYAGILEEINLFRSQQKLPAVAVDEKLSQAARHHANWMQKKGRATHVSSKAAHMEGSIPKSLAQWRTSTWSPLNRAIKFKYIKLEDVYRIESRRMVLISGVPR